MIPGSGWCGRRFNSNLFDLAEVYADFFRVRTHERSCEKGLREMIDIVPLDRIEEVNRNLGCARDIGERQILTLAGLRELPADFHARLPSKITASPE